MAIRKDYESGERSMRTSFMIIFDALLSYLSVILAGIFIAFLWDVRYNILFQINEEKEKGKEATYFYERKRGIKINRFGH